MVKYLKRLIIYNIELFLFSHCDGIIVLPDVGLVTSYHLPYVCISYTEKFIYFTYKFLTACREYSQIGRPPPELRCWVFIFWFLLSIMAFEISPEAF